MPSLHYLERSENEFSGYEGIYPVHLAYGLRIFKEQDYNRMFLVADLNEFHFTFNSEGIAFIMLEILVTNISI